MSSPCIKISQIYPPGFIIAMKKLRDMFQYAHVALLLFDKGWNKYQVNLSSIKISQWLFDNDFWWCSSPEQRTQLSSQKVRSSIWLIHDSLRYRQGSLCTTYSWGEIAFGHTVLAIELREVLRGPVLCRVGRHDLWFFVFRLILSLLVATVHNGLTITVRWIPGKARTMGNLGM